MQIKNQNLKISYSRLVVDRVEYPSFINCSCITAVLGEIRRLSFSRGAILCKVINSYSSQIYLNIYFVVIVGAGEMWRKTMMGCFPPTYGGDLREKEAFGGDSSGIRK